MDFIQAAKLKRYIKDRFSMVLHIHDNCGGLYISIDEPNETVKEFILAYCREIGVYVTVSEDGRSFFPTADPGDLPREFTVVFEKEKARAAAYDGDDMIGECTFTESSDHWTIDHTWVEPGYRNRDVASRLVECVVDEAKKTGKRVIPICSYAVKWMKERGI